MVIDDLTDRHDSRRGELTSAVARDLPAREWDEEWDDVAASLFTYPMVRLVADRFGGYVDANELVAETGLVRLAVHR